MFNSKFQTVQLLHIDVDINNMNNRLNNLGIITNSRTSQSSNEISLEQQQELTLRILEILNKQNSQIDVIRDVITEIQRYTLLSAVGIRLKDGDNYPYYESSGFSNDFIKSEMNLCSISPSRKILKNADGSCHLSCLCGAVIMGKENSNLSFLSQKGSYWTKHSSELLSHKSNESFPLINRNRCNEEGYKSVALIPLKAGDITIGLLQLNDFREDLFTEESITFFEKLSNCIGVTLSRTQIEEKKEKSKRAFQLLSNCNQVMLKAKSEIKFLNDICSLIVKIGGYKLAWVGFTEKNEFKNIKVIAQQGFEQDYLETLYIKLDETEIGKGYTDKAIKTNQPVIVEDILNDSTYNPLRETAIQRGYQSSIALPLIGSHCTFGALHIYSSEPHSFNKEELKLLLNLSENLAYGIEVLRSAKHKKLAETKLQKSEMKLLEAQKIAHIGYYAFDILTDEWTSSIELDKIFGIDSSYKKTISSWLKIIHPDHREMLSSYLLNDILRENKKFDKKYKIIDVKTGEEKWVHGLGEISIYDDGNRIEMFGTIQDITAQKKSEIALEESNIALNEILKTIESEKKEQLLVVQAHVNRTILPLVRKLEIGSNTLQSNYISLIVDNLNSIVSPFIGKLESQFINLTPREVEICKMLKDGLTSEEIAETLSTSVSTVFGQRKKIRKKLGLTNNNINLVSFLNSL